MMIIAKFLLFSIVYKSGLIVTSHPLDRKELFDSTFQNKYQYRLKDVIFFPDSPYVDNESSTRYNNLNSLQTNTVKDLNIRNHNTSPISQSYDKETTDKPSVDCSTLTDAQCDEYQKFISDIFSKTDENTDKTTKNNVISEENIIHRHQFKSFNDNIITCYCDDETTADYTDTTTITDDLSFRGAPPQIVASFLG